MVLDGATVFHVNVNCSDLERSRQFYCEGLGLTPGTRTTPPEVQDGAAFGLDSALWDAWILVGKRGFDGGAIDLLEWQTPAPTGAVLPAIHHAGWQRIGLMVRDIDEARASAIAHGGRAWSEPFDTGDTGAHDSMRLCFVTDPDGTAIELIHAGTGPSMVFVGLTCFDIERSLAFYTDLGFTEMMRVDAGRDTSDHLALDGPVAMQEILLGAPGSGDVSILLAGFSTPVGVAGEPRPANALGAWRVALLIDDLDAAVAGLRTRGIELLSEPANMAMGPGLPDLRFVCFRGPDHEVVELIERPQG